MHPPKHAPNLWLAAFIISVAVPVAGSGQEVIDQGTLLIRHGQREVGRETFTVTRTESGFLIIAATALYPPRRTRVVLQPRLQIRPDSQPQSLEFAFSNGNARKLYADFAPRRLTIRTRGPNSESAREFPLGPRNMIVDDSVFGLYAVPPRIANGPVRLFNPRTRSRLDYQMTVHGVETASFAGDSEALHVSLTAGDEVRHLWFTTDGRLLRVELPDQNVVVERIGWGEQQ